MNLTIVVQPEHRRDPEPPGRHRRDAQAQLLELGLEPGGPEEEGSDSVDEAFVTRTRPGSGRGGGGGDAGYDLVLTGPDEVTVPDVTRQSFGSARRAQRRRPRPRGGRRHRAAEPPVRTTRTRSRPRIPLVGTVVQPGQQVTLFPREEPAPPTGRHRRDRRDRRDRLACRSGSSARSSRTRNARGSSRTSRTSTGRSSRSRTCPRW